jgi:hypothetical protein
MAKKTDNASTFRIVAGVTAVLLLLAAGFVYLQATDGGDSTAPELAALSQAIPSQATRALGGENGAFDQLDTSIRKVASLRRGVSLGRSADWQQLESQASAILAKRSEVEAVNMAAAQAATDAAALVEGAIAGDVAFLRNAANGLAGDASDLDVRPLNAEAREAVLVPLLGSLTSLEEQSSTISTGIGQFGDLAAMQSQHGVTANQ